ncbi:MAG TPA: diacylglycerol kinase family protein [Candidatus Saccharimonadia bacterium]|nr:diacylglycerol kinase family protein [Candidatus Saccharimonadia bacterium]
MYYYIVNPAAGGAQNKALQEKLRSRLDQLGIRGEWVKTTAPGEATNLAAAAAAKGHTTIVAVGGDDTVNEVVNGVTEHEGLAVGIIPLGSTNRLATQLGITSWQQACEVLAARRLTSYSLIAAGQKYFLSTLTLGFETDLDKNVDTTATGWRARVGQLRAGWGHARNYQTLRCRINVDDQFKLDCSVFSLSIANQKFLNPLADNRLVVALSDHPGRQLQLGNYVWQMLHSRIGRGTNPATASFAEDAATTRFLAQRVVIETEPVTGIMVDGKVAGRTPIAIRLTDRHVRFITEKVVADFKDAVGPRSK